VTRKPGFPPGDPRKWLPTRCVLTWPASHGSHHQPPFNATRVRWQFLGISRGFSVRFRTQETPTSATALTVAPAIAAVASKKEGGRIALAPSPALRAVVLGREDGTKVVLEEMPKVEDVVQTNVIAVVKPVQRSNKRSPATPDLLAHNKADDLLAMLPPGK
jgi:hypothetical protein